LSRASGENMKDTYSRSGFSTLEPIIVSVILMVFGLLVTLIVRKAFSVQHWISWGPAVLFSLPFLFVCVVVILLVIRGIFRERK
jgi:phosphoglycerol transferase MdoB-like AlkP superfamily enzyme